MRFALPVLAILSSLHVYIGWRLLPALPFHPLGHFISIMLLVLSTFLIPMGMLAHMITSHETRADQLSWSGSLAMGLFSSLLVLTFLRDIGLALWVTFSQPIASELLNVSSMTAMLVPCVALLVTFIGFINARSLPRIVDVNIPLANLPQALHGFTIVQLSDIHVGSTIKNKYVQAVVDRVNTLNADLIAVTGDVVDGSVQQLSPHTAPLGEMKSRHGTFFVTGNHEYYSGAKEWVAEFRRIGFHCLMNEHVLLEHEGASLIIAGVTDYKAHTFDATQRSDPQAALAGAPEHGSPKILLAHQPRSAKAASKAGFDLQLSGHTHGGQFWPWNHFVRFQQPYTAGLHRLKKLWVYTSRGTGYWGPPKRFGAPAEITRLRLVAAS
ncbi:MAG: metallophosphoesterase [Pseudomonadota bacterium]